MCTDLKKAHKNKDEKFKVVSKTVAIDAMKKTISLLWIVLLLFSCGSKKQEATRTSVHPEWVYDAVIYEVNTRQYTPEGTFTAFAAHLPRLKELGADLLWFMPVQPIGEKDRKGTLGSYYSIRN